MSVKSYLGIFGTFLMSSLLTQNTLASSPKESSIAEKKDNGNIWLESEEILPVFSVEKIEYLCLKNHSEIKQKETIIPSSTETPQLLAENCFKESSILAGDNGEFLLTELPAKNSGVKNNILSQVAEEETQQKDNSWRFKIQPYFTIPIDTSGTITINGNSRDYDLDLGEFLDGLRFNINGRFEAWKGNLGLIVDASYVNLGGIKNVQLEPNGATVESEVKYKQGVYDFLVSYHLGAAPMHRLPESPSNKNYPLFWFEPIAGVRLNDLSQSAEADVSFPGLGQQLELEFNQSRTWFQPLLGGKVGMQVSDPVTFWVRGDVSGFGLAGDTDMVWNVFAGLDWWVARNISLQVAYRIYDFNYKNGSGENEFGLDQKIHGPVLSATFHF